jgi:hypothetical protein
MKIISRTSVLLLGMVTTQAVLADTVSINFDTFPGTDCQLGTSNDIETVHGESVANQYRCVGAVLSLTDGSAPTLRQQGGTYSSFTRTLSPINAAGGGEPAMQDIVIDFTVPTKRVKLTSLDTDEPVTLRAFNAQGTEIASDYQRPKGDLAVETVEVQVDGSQGFITKVVVDLTQSNKKCCAAGPESYDLLEFDPIDVPSECKLYGVHDEGRNDSQFVTIDPDDNFKVCPLSKYPEHDIEALDIHPQTGVIYAASGKDTNMPGYLYRLNGQTGELTPIGPTGFDEIDALSFAPDGTLWGWAQDVGLLTINTSTGKASVVVEYAGEIEDLTWNTAGTVLYGVGNLLNGPADAGMKLLAYDSHQGTLTPICEQLTDSREVEALETLPDDTLIFGLHGKTHLPLGAIDVQTCQIVAATEISTNYNDIEGLAWPDCR